MRIAAISLMALMLAPALQAQEESTAKPVIGLSVSPGGMMIQDVAPGQLYDLAQRSGVMLKISNSDAKPRTFRLFTSKPSAVGNGKWLSGYQEIPDSNWFWFEKQEITVEPQSEGSVKMYLKVPEGEQHYNQHWTVSIGVQGVSESGEMMALAVYPRYQIETRPKPDVQVATEALQPGKKQELSVALRNNEAKPVRYALSIKTIPVDPTREQIIPLPGNAWAPNLNWLSIQKKRITIEGGQSRSISVKINIPKTAENFGKHWEALLWAEPEAGQSQFARIQLETTKAP